MSLNSEFIGSCLSFRANFIQRCPQYIDKLNREVQADTGRLLLLKHENGIPVPDGVERMFENQITHDPSDIHAARAIAEDATKIPCGLLYRNENAQRYDDLTCEGINMTDKQRMDGFNAALDKFAI